MNTLNTQTVVTTFNSASSAPSYAGTFKMEVPQSSVMLSKPLSYEFRVAEYFDGDGKLLKVGLQVQVWEHDNYGAGSVLNSWTDVPRVKLVNGVVHE